MVLRPRLAPLAVALLVAVPGVGQCHGGGAARLRSSTLAAGAVVTTTVEGPASAAYGVYYSLSLAPTTIPGLGTVCLDLGSPTFGLAFAGTLDLTGQDGFAAAIPLDPAWLSVVYWIQGAVVSPIEPLGLALTNTLRKDYEVQASWTTVASLPTALHRPAAAMLPDRGWIFATGSTSPSGGTSLALPLLRTAIVGPDLQGPGYGATATTLADGRVLVAGGAISTTGPAIATCRIFDPASLSVVPAAPMREPRYAHVATRLDDGRVLVVGGSRSADERIPATGAPPEAPHFTLISDTSEIYDPVADRWTLVSETPSMRRVGHTVTKLDDGRVLVVGGFTHATFGGSTPFNLHAIPFATSSCALFDPASNRFAPAAPIEARGFHAATRGPNGAVFVSGGQFAEILGPSSPNTWISRGRASTFVYAAGAWSAGPPLPSARILHGQVALGNGRILIAGGAQVTTNFGPWSVFGDALLWDGGAQFLSTTPLPTARYRFAFATYPDGSPAAIGGFEAAATNIIPALAATLYTPAP